MASAKRIAKELKDITAKPVAGVTCGPVGGDNYKWQAVFSGPAGTPYAGGSFKMDITFPQNYPFKAPAVKFATKIYHPNIGSSADNTGDVCLEMLRNWQAGQTITKLLETIMGLLTTPNCDDALESAIADEYKNKKADYTKKATQWTASHAK